MMLAKKLLLESNHYREARVETQTKMKDAEKLTIFSDLSR